MGSAASSIGDLLHADGHPAVKGSWLAAMAILSKVEPGIKLHEGEVTACGHIWQDTDLRGDVRASVQPARVAQCDHLDIATARALRNALD